MRILLVLPATDHLRVTRLSPSVPNRKMLRFSVLPLTAVAALTPEGHEVRICDENVEALDLDQHVDLVGVSFMTAYAQRAYEIAREFRRRGVVTVAGGYHPTFLPDEAARHFDAVVVGDAEGLWQQVVEDAAGGRLQPVYRQSTPPDLACVPEPRRDLVRRTARHYVTVDAVQTGRGCQHACRFCSVTAFHGARRRSRPLTDVLRELRAIDRDLIFVDDNIIADPDYARRLFEALVPMRKRWVSQCSLALADDPALLRLARRAGCRGLFIGVETTSPTNLAAMQKSVNRRERYLESIGRIRRAGIGVIAGMIVGLDGDDASVFRRTLRFLDEARIDALQLGILTPLPGTPLFADMEREGRILDRDWSHYDFRHVVFEPRRMTREQLQAGADWLYAQYYRTDRILRRAARTLVAAGPTAALLALRLNLTYRYDNRREGIRGFDPARRVARSALAPQLSTASAPPPGGSSA